MLKRPEPVETGAVARVGKRGHWLIVERELQCDVNLMDNSKLKI